MNKHIQTLLVAIGLALATGSAFAQNLHVQYDVLFNERFDRPGSMIRTLKGHLLIDDRNASVFFMIPEYDMLDNDQQVDMPQDTIWRVIISEAKGSEVFEDIYNEEGKTRWFADSLYPMKWNLSNETKEIDSLVCHKATTFYRGRNYVAWYCPQYPIPRGPWKIGGLPGLIINLEDEEQNLQITAISLRYSDDRLQIPDPKPRPFKSYVDQVNQMRQAVRESQQVSDCITCESKSQFFSWEKGIFK